MPTIVIGADTAPGRAIVEAMHSESPEVRAFVTNPEAAAALKAAGTKVAVGDLTDESHVAAAARGTFCAILVGEAASDDRARAFAGSVTAVVTGWASALKEAGTTRAIWVGDPLSSLDTLAGAVSEVRTVETTGRDLADVVRDVLAADAAHIGAVET
jgi:uncharacterized protein YbjT (DUF2867 family)